MSLARYAAVVLGIVGGSLALLWPLVLDRLPAATGRAVLVGAALAAANTLLAYGLVRWSEKRAVNVFMGAVLGGMVGRMALMLAAVVMAVLAFGLPKVPLAVSLLGYFVLFLVFELGVLHQQRPGAVAR